MSDRCPSCRRTIAATDARCPRCGANVSGVEIEGLTPAFGGDEVVVDGRGPRPTRFSRRTIGALAAVVILGLAAVATRGGGAATTASTVTPTTIGADDAATSTTTSTEAPTTTALDPAPTTTTTTVKRDIAVENLGAEVSMTTTFEREPLALRQTSGLTVVSISGSQTAFVTFDELDTGRETTVTVHATGPGGTLASFAAPFPGGAVLVVSRDDATGAAPAVDRSVLAYANGAVREIAGVGAPVQGYGGGALTSPAWFKDSTDPHTVHLVDLATAGVVRSTTLPGVVVPVVVDGPTLVVGDPSGQLYDVAEDGSLTKRSLGVGRRGNGRRGELSCDEALGSCVLEYVDEVGNRAQIVDADHALATAAVVAPSGPHLAALVPIVMCGRTCSNTGAPTPLTVYDIDRQTSYAVGPTTGKILEFGPAYDDTSGAMTWSSDGQWLFFPTVAANGSTVGNAWRPGLLPPVEIADTRLSSLLTQGGPSVVFPTDTPMPAPAG